MEKSIRFSLPFLAAALLGGVTEPASRRLLRAEDAAPVPTLPPTCRPIPPPLRAGFKRRWKRAYPHGSVLAQIADAETAADLIAALDRGLDCKEASDSTMRKWKKAALDRCHELGLDPGNLAARGEAATAPVA